MYFTFSCPHCEKKLKVREEIAGRNVGCPYCRKSLVVPRQAVTPPVEAPPVASDVKDKIDVKVSDAPQVNTSVSSRRKPTAKPVRKDAPAAGVGGDSSHGADVSMVLSGAIALAASAVFLGVMYPLSLLGGENKNDLTGVAKTARYFGDLFLDRGWVPFALVFLMSWSLAILVFKTRKLKMQKRSMLFDVLPFDESRDITVDSLDEAVAHIRGLPVDPGASFLVNRVLRGLEHFRVRRGAAEVSTVLASQSEIDANAVESSYTLLKVFIWAIPILGFIGTVIGIGGAVGGFSESLGGAAELDALKQSLNNVTGGLSTAFDTTLVALVMSLLVMFPTSSMQKAEEDLLNWVDEYCNENLLKRLDDGGARMPTAGGDAGLVQQAIDAALSQQRIELDKWAKTLRSIGSTLTEQVVDGWTDINQQLKTQHEQKLKESEQLADAAIQFRESLAALNEQVAQVRQGAVAPVESAAQAFQQHLAALETGLSSLNVTLEKLTETEVVVRKRRRGWRLYGGK
jgi:biopolymer transport protein ExbB/TolQ/DNA-directed RNA polymerase subunit RPC12/RpoP